MVMKTSLMITIHSCGEFRLVASLAFRLGNDVEEESILLDILSTFESKVSNKILVANFLTILVGGFNPIEKY